MKHLRFNTAISQLMVFINEAYKADQFYLLAYVEGFVKLIAPICSAYCGRTLGKTWT